MNAKCEIKAVGKRRDGGTRFWCLAHKADATAKYGVRAKRCRHAHIAPPTKSETLVLDVSRYPGGIAIWGAVPPVYDTTNQPLDRGIHVHARLSENEPKVIDKTYRSVRLKGFSDSPHGEGFAIAELDAIYYMVTSVFGFEMKFIECSYCQHPHLDKDWFAVHAHRRHLCAGCGQHFRDTNRAIGNPAWGTQSALKQHKRRPAPAKEKLSIKQSDFPGGIQIWGSNPAIVWTGERAEREGIHVHAYGMNRAKPDPDGTFSQVTIDGVTLDPLMVRTLMAQAAMPHIAHRVVALECPKCATSHFARGAEAFTPATKHECRKCKQVFSNRGRFRNVVGNPLLKTFDHLAKGAPRPRQTHELNLLPETI